MYGLFLIGLILTVFAISNQPSKEELAKQQKEKAKQEALAVKKDADEDKKTDSAKPETTVQKKHVNPLYVSKGELIRLENEKIIVDFSTKGGKVAAVYLKEFETYKNYAENKGKKIPLKLFEDGDASNELSFPMDGKKFKTGNLGFEVKRKTKSSITFTLSPEEGQTIEYVYRLKKDAYDLDYYINIITTNTSTYD